MLLNLIRFIFLFVGLHGYHRWTVRWNNGLPRANSKPGESISLRDGQWVVDRSDEYHNWEETYGTLWAVFDLEIPSRLDHVCGPARAVHRAMLLARSAMSLPVLLVVLKDSDAWTKSIWSCATYTETTYKNASGWVVTHYSNGGVHATNIKTSASISYIAAGRFGYWHVTSGFKPNWVNCPGEGRKYPLGKHTVFMLPALLGI